MLVVSRYKNQRIVIEPAGIEITITAIENGGEREPKVRIGVDAPSEQRIYRKELLAIPEVREEIKELKENGGS